MDGEPAVLTVVRDISARKAAEEQVRKSLREKETLLKEIHHRVKNNLQVVSGLINLQAIYIPDQRSRQLYKDSQNRIKTMALIHEELYQHDDLASIDFADYIRGLASNLAASYGVEPARISLDVEQLLVPLDTAIPCGLIVNELVSNALKHAFPEERKGMIKIYFSSDENDGYILEVTDDGVGIPAEMQFGGNTSLGMQLVSLLAEQLGARLESSRERGTSFVLRFSEYTEAGTVLF
jgi:two-component sensor histidine kinase